MRRVCAKSGPLRVTSSLGTLTCPRNGDHDNGDHDVIHMLLTWAVTHLYLEGCVKRQKVFQSRLGRALPGVGFGSEWGFQ